MSRTPDRYDGPAIRDGVCLEETVTAAATEGEMRYVSGAFSFFDAIGEFNPRSALPTATAVGQVLISTDGATFTVQQPSISGDGYWVTNDDGELLVCG